MRVIRTAWNAGLLFAIVTGLAAPAAVAQSVMTDRETTARAAQLLQAAEWRLAFRPSLSVLRQTVSQLRTLPRVTDGERNAADDLLKQASDQSEPDARGTLWRAATLLQGRPWTEAETLAGSLALRSTTPISTGENDRIRFDQLYPANAPEKISYSLDLVASAPTSSATPVRGEVIKRVASGELAKPFPNEIGIDLTGIADGPYLLIARASIDIVTSTELAQPIFLVRNLASRYSTLRSELASVTGRDASKWIAEYPFALAEAIRADKREVISYDFPKAISRSHAVVAELKAGRDGVWQAKGLQDRAYRFEETGELIPYQLYVPSTWTADRKWPLLVALHGANLDETNMLGRNGGAMQKLAEQHGVIVLSPLGYRLNSGYGSERGVIKALVGEDTARLRRSEQDVLQAMALVEKEYNVDPARRYLAGNSMGGGGTWWIGGRYPERWAAIAPAAYGDVLPEDVAGLSKVPILAVVGDRDELGMHEKVRQAVATLEAGGVKPQYLEVKGGTHAGAFDSVLPQVFEFLARHAR
jgi:poly(3-hydroxybutyrate) depolymerase